MVAHSGWLGDVLGVEQPLVGEEAPTLELLQPEETIQIKGTKGNRSIRCLGVRPLGSYNRSEELPRIQPESPNT